MEMEIINKKENQKFSLKIGDKTIEIENKNLAEQANGNILITCGGTSVLATAVMGRERDDINFFPLMVDYEEKYYAAGKIKGARYIRREGRPSDEAVCNSRLIDRCLRPLFDKDIKLEMQVIATVFSWDGKNDSDILAMISSSAALHISDIPWNGPIGAVRVGKINGDFVLNPTYEERENSKIDIVFTGIIEKGELLINMIEGGFEEVKEDEVAGALNFAKEYLIKVINFQEEIRKEIGKEKAQITLTEKDENIEKEIKEFLGNKLKEATFTKDKKERSVAQEKLKEELILFLKEKDSENFKERYIKNFFEKEIDRIIHEGAIKFKKRVDGRALDEVREIKCEVGILPRTHGSGLFSRGQTKGLSILTLGSPGDQQLIESMELAGKKRFMHHYNFPPFSVGETRPMRGPGRREIGHGMLAEKALLPLLPNAEDFPYTIRIVSEMLSSNGSTSMASISSSSLALMDAGVPIKRPATGIAIGIMQDEETLEYEILTDIQGPEDHHGDMDFKVAGTEEGITAIQLDVKIKGITSKILEEVLVRAKNARLHILNKIKEVIPEPRKELSPFAPRILTLQIDPDKIREVVGTGGKVINEIIAQTGATIDIEQTGLIFITSDNSESAKKAIDWIKDIVREVEVGEIFEGKVERILDFGAFVSILPNQDGLIHISKLASHRVNKVEDIVNIGDTVSVKVIAIDEQGRINLSLIENKSKKKK